MTAETEGALTEEMLTTQAVADLYIVDVSTVRRWVRNGILPAVRTPGGGRIRFRASDIRERLAQAGVHMPGEDPGPHV